jgi:hypothetical protein
MTTNKAFRVEFAGGFEIVNAKSENEARDRFERRTGIDAAAVTVDVDATRKLSARRNAARVRREILFDINGHHGRA